MWLSVQPAKLIDKFQANGKPENPGESIEYGGRCLSRGGKMPSSLFSRFLGPFPSFRNLLCLLQRASRSLRDNIMAGSITWASLSPTSSGEISCLRELPQTWNEEVYPCSLSSVWHPLSYLASLKSMLLTSIFQISKYSSFDLGKDGSQNPSGMLKGYDFRGSPREQTKYSHGVKGRDTILSVMILVPSGRPG